MSAVPLQRFFIVGCPRSGTTLLQQALNRHPGVVIPPETAFFSMLGYSRQAQRRHLRRINEDLEIDLPVPERRLGGPAEAGRLFDLMAEHYVRRHGRADVTHFGEKTPEHLRRLGRIRSAFPDAKVVLIYRDGRDVALSLLGLPWTSRDLYVNFALWLHCYRLQQAAERGAHPTLLTVRYEDLVCEPEREFGRVLSFLGLPYDRNVVSGHGNTVGVPQWEYEWKGRAMKPITTARIGTWRKELSADQLGILERWGGAALRRLGYELDTDGRHPLPWFFHLRVAWNSLLWLARRPGYDRQKVLWLQKTGRDVREVPTEGCSGKPNRVDEEGATLPASVAPAGRGAKTPVPLP